MHYRIFLLCCWFLFSVSLPKAFTQDADTEQQDSSSGNSLFSWLYTGTDSILEMTIETDVRGLIRQKLKEEYQPAKLTVRNAAGELFEKDFKLRARGNRRKEVCYYPPVKLKFKKSDLTSAGLSSLNDFKLVTQCRETQTCEYYIAKEYLAYKLYSILSPHSFRVQLFRVTFIDSQGKGKSRDLLGFMIEPDEELTQRINGVTAERSAMRSSFLSDEPHQRMAIFQYMIGNTDWAVGNSHNLIFVKIPEYDRLTPIPYDFDYSGLVNTDYAVPFNTLPIKSVTERLYRGIECTETEIPGHVAYFQSRKEEIMNYVKNFPHLHEYVRREVEKYLEEFFHFLDNPRNVREAFGSH